MEQMTSSEDQLKKRNVPSQHWEQFSIHFFFPLMMLELFPRKPITELLVDVNRKEAKKKEYLDVPAAAVTPYFSANGS